MDGKSRAADRKAKRKIKAKMLWPIARPRTAIIKELDNLASLYVRMRNKLFGRGLCEICGVNPATMAYHYFSRRFFSIRWDPQNIAASCWGCNRGEKLNRYMPIIENRHKGLLGEIIYNILKDKSLEPARNTNADLLTIRDRLKLMIETIQARR